jgi:hypothetical protein
MPQQTKIFRVFVSSTFTDMVEERNKLQEFVFPRLRELAEDNNCRFQAIDLRWGVSEEASFDQQAMNICLKEIERSQSISPRPNFIILLGDRFGWCPLPYAIPVSEMDLMVKYMIKEEIELTLWLEKPEEAIEMISWNNGKPTGTKGWYRKDENAIPPEYVLQPRMKNTIFEVSELWESQVEHPLLNILKRTAKQAGLSNDELVKYTLSATGQEILHGAMNVEDAQDHVFGFFRTITNPEKLKGTPEENIYLGSNSELSQQQCILKGKLKQKLKVNPDGNIHEFTVEWQGREFTTDHIGSLPNNLKDCLKLNSNEKTPQNFCEAVWLRLSQVIIAEAEKLKIVDPLDNELETHTEFGQDRASFFVGREDNLSQIVDYLENSNPHLLAIWGKSGAGKSSLIAKSIEEAQTKYKTAMSIFRFIGATPESSNVRKLLESLCRQLTRVYKGDEKAIPSDSRELVQELYKRMALAGEVKSIIIFIDALDQLEELDYTIISGLLVQKLPPNVKMVISSLPGELMDVLENHLPSTSILEVKALSLNEGAELLNKWLKNYKVNRCLTKEQTTDILSKFEKGGGLPLYLKLSFEDAQHWHSYDDLPVMSGIKPGLSDDIPGIIRDLFCRLLQESQHGKVIVERVLGYLAAVRKGLTEDELIDLLWEQDGEMRTDFLRRSPNSPITDQMPVIIWSRLFMDLKPYLKERQVDDIFVISFYHRQVLEVAIEYFLQGDSKRLRHRSLANKFENASRGNGNNYSPNKRAISEFAYHYRICNDEKKLKDIYSNMSYICNFIKCHNAFDLKQEISFVPYSCIDNEVRSFISNTAFILAKNPEQAPQLIYKEMGKVSFREQAELLAVRPWIKADRIHLENKAEENLISVIPALSKEMHIQASCIAQKANIAFVHNASEKIELLSTDDIHPIGEISLTTKPPVTIKKLLCGNMGNLLALVYDNGRIEVLRIIYNKKGNILSTQCIHTGICVTGKFGAISAFSSFDEIIYQDSDTERQIVRLKIGVNGEILNEYMPSESKTLMSYFGNDVRCFVWKDKNEYLLVLSESHITIKASYKLLAICKFGDRLIVSTEESNLLIYRLPNAEIEKAISNRLPIISICKTDSDILLMTDRHGNILSLDNNLNLIEHGRCSQDLYDDYPSAIYFTGNSGVFYISQRRCVTLSSGTSSINNVIIVDGEKEYPNILKYSRSNGFELSIGRRSFYPLKQDLLKNHNEFEYANFKVAWSPSGTVAYSKTTNCVTIENSEQSINHETESEIVKIIYYDNLDVFLVLCCSGELYDMSIDYPDNIPFKVPMSNSGNYLMELCGKYVCIVSMNVLSSSFSINTYTETVLSIYNPLKSGSSIKLNVVDCQHIDNYQTQIKSISYNQEVNSLFLYREGIIEQWHLDNPKEYNITKSDYIGDRNALLSFCAYKNGGLFVSTNNTLKLQTMLSQKATAELSSYRTITFLSQMMGKYGYFIENNQIIYTFKIEEE